MPSTRVRARQTLIDATAQRDRARRRLAALCRGENSPAEVEPSRAVERSIMASAGQLWTPTQAQFSSWNDTSLITTIQTVWSSECTYQLTQPIYANAGDTIYVGYHIPQEVTLTWQEPWTWTGTSTGGGNGAQPWGWNTSGATYTQVTTNSVVSAVPEDPEALQRRQQEIIERYIRAGQMPPAPYAALMTQQQRNVAESNARQREIELAQRREVARVANERAYALLDMLLSDEQRRELRENSTITVHSPAGNTYRLARGVRSGNVDCWDPERQQWSANLCVHLRSHYPDGDNLAAQLLAIQTDEADFLWTANASGVLPAGMAVVRRGARRRWRWRPR